MLISARLAGITPVYVCENTTDAVTVTKMLSDCFAMLFTVQRWASAFRSPAFHIRVNTNNGVERQNRTLKYDYLQPYRDTSLSGVMTVLVEKKFS